jgi:hypothetical protein
VFGSGAATKIYVVLQLTVDTLCFMPSRGLISDEEKTDTDARQRRRGTAAVFDKQALICRRYSGVSQGKR